MAYNPDKLADPRACLVFLTDEADKPVKQDRKGAVGFLARDPCYVTPGASSHCSTRAALCRNKTNLR